MRRPFEITAYDNAKNFSGKSNKNKSTDKIRDNVTSKDLPNCFFGSLTGGYKGQCWPPKYTRSCI